MRRQASAGEKGRSWRDLPGGGGRKEGGEEIERRKLKKVAGGAENLKSVEIGDISEAAKMSGGLKKMKKKMA